jgi:teichuronic acid biosynthesis glycosyltransferase TuaH
VESKGSGHDRPRVAPRIALVSLEPWDDTWRRNQHLVAALTRLGIVSEVLFLEPPRLRGGPARRRAVLPGVQAVPLRLRLPKRLGGLQELGLRLRRSLLSSVDLLWINDPALGVHCVDGRRPAIYDVTDDWRTYDFPPRIQRRIVRAEDRLTRTAQTIVCSEVLRQRWKARYEVHAKLIHNGVDANAWALPERHDYGQGGPHVGYIGTLQSERLDVELVLRIAADDRVGRVHLVGPDALDTGSRERLMASPKVHIHGPVPAAQVPARMLGLDVLLSPHVMTPFTLSLDAIKSYEYLVSGRPIAATPTSGFQHLVGHERVFVAERAAFDEALQRALVASSVEPSVGEFGWERRARQFGEVFRDVSPSF